MNSAVIPEPGTYRYVLLTEAEAVQWLRTHDWQSRIGYPATAQHIKESSGIQVPLNRERSEMQPDDEGLVVRLKYRLDNPMAKANWQPAPDDWEHGLLTRLS